MIEYVIAALGVVALVSITIARLRCPVCQSTGAICDDMCPMRSHR